LPWLADPAAAALAFLLAGALARWSLCWSYAYVTNRALPWRASG